MTMTAAQAGASGGIFGFLDRSRTIARPGFSRWMVPPAALCIHLVHRPSLRFQRVQSADDQAHRHQQVGAGRLEAFTELGWIFSIAIFFLGVSAAVCGRWVEEGGPRRAMFTAGLCWAVGFFISAVGVYVHNIWLIYIGYGFFGGIGLGLGYISPVSTLIKWFPDRPGMATGMAIMGFGGGAFIASPLSVWLMRDSPRRRMSASQKLSSAWASSISIFMWIGAAIVRIPAPGWKPEGYIPPVSAQKLITRNDVYVYDAIKTPQFWLIWWVLCLNVTAGIGVLGQASAMSQEMFPGKVTAIAAAGFVGLLSLFNMLGRFFWASTSDFIGRKNTYFCFFVIGTVLYALVPWTGEIHSVALLRAVLPGDHQHVRRRLRHRAGISQRHVRDALCRRHPRLVDHGMVGGRVSSGRSW